MHLQPNNINQNNLYPPPNVTTINQQFPLKIATFNVNGLCTTDPIKQQLLLDTMDLQKIQICGVSETNLNEQSSKLFTKMIQNTRHSLPLIVIIIVVRIPAS